MNRTSILRLGALLLAAVLAGCAQVTKVASGEAVVRRRCAWEYRLIKYGKLPLDA